MPGRLQARRNSYVIYQKMWGFVDCLYPPHCGGCEKPGSRWCAECQSQVTLIGDYCCPICGQAQTHPGVCTQCRTQPHSVKAIRSWAIFEGPLRNALHRLKYARDIGLGEVLSRHLVDLLFDLGWDIDCIIPVPLGAVRQSQRGYNQTALLAYPLALATGIAYKSKGLKKIKETRTQVGLTIEQRHENVAGAFLADPKIVKNRKVLLIDDVTTSGATIESCASAIMIADADQVFGMTLARARRSSASVHAT